MFCVQNYYLFQSVTASIKLSVFPPDQPVAPLRAITEGQSEIEKLIWRRLVHLQSALMTAASFLQLLAQSHGNLFLRSCGQKSSIIL